MKSYNLKDAVCFYTNEIFDTIIFISLIRKVLNNCTIDNENSKILIVEFNKTTLAS